MATTFDEAPTKTVVIAFVRRVLPNESWMKVCVRRYELANKMRNLSIWISLLFVIIKRI